MDNFSVRMKQHRKYKRIYDDIQRHKGSVVSQKHPNKHTNKQSFAAEDIMRHKPIIFMDDEKKIFQSGNWRSMYHLYTLTNSFDDVPVDELTTKLKKVCLSYIESLVWTTHYYFDECISQEWSYPYEFAPPLQDVSSYLQREKRVRLPEHRSPYTPLEQLQFVFPYQSYHLCDELEVDEGVSFTKEIKDEFMLMKRYDWECHPIF
jgi:5'-3' exonuclease